MTIMGEPVTNFAPIEKIPGVKPPLGLETRPAAAPKLSPIQAAVLDELRRSEDPRECEHITRAIRSSLPGMMFEEVAEALGDLFDLGLAYRPAKGKWLAKVVVEHNGHAPARPAIQPVPEPASAPTIAQERPRAEAARKPDQASPGASRETVRARLQAAAPTVGAEVALADVFPDREERARVKREIHEWTEFRTETRVVPGKKGTRVFATRMHMDHAVASKPKTTPAAENENHRVEMQATEVVKPIPSRSEAPKLDALIQRAKAECDAKIHAAQLAFDAVQREAIREFEARVEGITWAMKQIGGAA